MLITVMLGLVLLALLVGLCFLLKHKVKNDKTKYIILLSISLLTLIIHLSGIPYVWAKNGWEAARTTIRGNPGYIIPCYPCNLVMIACIILGFMKNKDNKIGRYLNTYVIYFGLIAGVVGLLFNPDTNLFFKDHRYEYDLIKSFFSHGSMVLNIMLLITWGYMKFDFKVTSLHMVISIFMMAAMGAISFGILCGWISYDFAIEVNPFFMFKSPIAKFPFLIYPLLAAIALILYILIFFCIQKIINKKRNNI